MYSTVKGPDNAAVGRVGLFIEMVPVAAVVSKEKRSYRHGP
jgi:hypothetical protein